MNNFYFRIKSIMKRIQNIPIRFRIICKLAYLEFLLYREVHLNSSLIYILDKESILFDRFLDIHTHKNLIEIEDAITICIDSCKRILRYPCNKNCKIHDECSLYKELCISVKEIEKSFKDIIDVINRMKSILGPVDDFIDNMEIVKIMEDCKSIKEIDACGKLDLLSEKEFEKNSIKYKRFRRQRLYKNFERIFWMIIGIVIGYFGKILLDCIFK